MCESCAHCKLTGICCRYIQFGYVCAHGLSPVDSPCAHSQFQLNACARTVDPVVHSHARIVVCSQTPVRTWLAPSGSAVRTQSALVKSVCTHSSLQWICRERIASSSQIRVRARLAATRFGIGPPAIPAKMWWAHNRL